jgi:hypothetical protein
MSVPCAYGDTAAMSVAILNMSDGSVASSITWHNANVGSGWMVADQYLQIASTLTTTGSGIQTYTNNTAVGANPFYTGNLTTAAGLVDMVDTTRTLPTAWEITPSGQGPNPAGDPNTTFVWFYHMDRAQPNFLDGFWYIEMEESGGSNSPPLIQFAQGSFGQGDLHGVNNVYLEANFQVAVGAPYQTSTLTVELFTP